MLNSDWLEELFGPYDLYYLDPLIAKSAARKQNRMSPSGHRSWHPSVRKDPSKRYSEDGTRIQEFLKRIRKIIGTDDSDLDQSEFVDEMVRNGLLTDRAKQKQIVDVIGVALKGKQISDARKFSSVKHLCEASKRLRTLPNQTTSDTLVIVDGMINRVDEKILPELYAPVQVSPHIEDRQTRLVHFVLSDLPWPLMWLDTPSVGLMVCDKALAIAYSASNPPDIVGDAVRLDGWYPFARVMGYWQTDRGGRPYIDVLAILIKSYPTIDEMFRELTAGSKRKLEDMLELGQDVTETSFKDFATKGYDSANDGFLLFPMLLFCLCFHLNLIDTVQLKNRAPGVYAVFMEYRNKLDELADLLSAKNTTSLIPSLLRMSRRSLIKLLN